MVEHFQNTQLANSAPGNAAGLKVNPDNLTDMAARQRLAGTSGDHTGWLGAGWPGPCPVRFWVSPLMETPQPLLNQFQCLTTGKKQIPRCSPEVSTPAHCIKPLCWKTCSAVSHTQQCSLNTHLISLNTTLLVAHYMVLHASLRLKFKKYSARSLRTDSSFSSPPAPAHEVCDADTEPEQPPISPS